MALHRSAHHPENSISQNGIYEFFGVTTQKNAVLIIWVLKRGRKEVIIYRYCVDYCIEVFAKRAAQPV